MTYEATILQTYRRFSPKDVYKFHCEKIGVKEISGVRLCLSGMTEDFESAKELDFSLMYLGDNGCYPVLEMVRALHKTEVLRLRSCELSNVIAKLIAKVGATHPSLRTLDVSDNPFISAPGGEMLVQMAKRNPQILRILVSGTNIPKDVLRKLDAQLQKNVEAFLELEDKKTVHRYLFEVALDEILTNDEKRKLLKPMRTRRLCDDLTCEQRPRVELCTADWQLPTLTREEQERAKKSFSLEDVNTTGVLSFRRIINCLHRFGATQVDDDDAFLTTIFGAINTNEDGFMTYEEWVLLLRNYLMFEGGNYRANHMEQLRAAYDVVATGEETTALQASTCISNLSNIIGRNLPESLEDKVQSFLVASSGLSTTDETLIPMDFSTFAEAEAAGQILIDPVLRAAVVLNKLLIEPNAPGALTRGISSLQYQAKMSGTLRTPKDSGLETCSALKSG
eukprot:TRINITY_DN30819_c0_g1_i1.p1 TRINITY_DN30819_c0_g1~~TRINITY_DN30819_c0_g1_i1.p1  ORF type:complete len:478 (+),score=224.13 TRINITY_DN30819_c0_g1_i1:83-1435(+)